MYGFCNKSFRKDETLTSWTLFSTYLSSKLDSPLIKTTLERIRFSSNQNIGEGGSNFDDKYVEKNFQLVRGSSFRNDLLQNPYFSICIKLFAFLPIWKDIQRSKSCWGLQFNALAYLGIFNSIKNLLLKIDLKLHESCKK